jgi:Fe-S cluster biogenesis protein NfuA
VFLGYDFITVTKDGSRLAAHEAGDPRQYHGTFHVRPAGHGKRRARAMREGRGGEEFFDKGDEDDRRSPSRNCSTRRVRPAVAQDGGDITFKGFRDGVVYLNMKGACSGCPSSTATLKHGMQNLLRHFVPEVQEVEAVM